MILYPHQKNFLDKNPDKALICFETGTGKTLVAVEWLRPRQGNALVIVPKRIVNKWQKELGDVKATIITKEQFKKVDFENPTAIVLDEAQFASSPLFTKQRSQISEKVYNLIKKYPNCPVLLLTATPISSSPANLHSLLCYIGEYTPWIEWRARFYSLERKPYLPRPAWIPKTNWRTEIRKELVKNAHIALMKDCVEYLPQITETIVKTPVLPFTKHAEWEAMKAFVEEHRNEQKEKSKTIREIGSGYRKVVVVAYFREQIEELYTELSKDKKTYVLHGGTKDQEEVIKQAKDDDECYFILQSSIAAGFDLNEFAVMIFASQGYSYTASVQVKGRVVRIHDLHPVHYYYLLGGRIDRAVFDRLKLGQDFDPKYFYEITRPAKKIK